MESMDASPREVLPGASQRLKDEFEAMAAPAIAASERRELLQEQTADAAMMDSVRRVRGPP